MPNFTLTGTTRRPFGTVRGGRQTLRQLLNWLEAIISGEVAATNLLLTRNDAVALGDEAFAGQAVGAMELAAGAGAVGVTVDGAAPTGAVWAVSDANTMALVCAAIRADAAINRKVTAVNRVAQVTLAAVAVGDTVDIFGIRFTALAGAPTAYGEFDQSGADAADATSLALAINRHPALNGRCRAVSSAAIVYVGLLEDRAPTSEELINLPAATITVNTAFPTAGAIGLVMALVPGDIGNCCTVVPFGVGMTYATSNAGKLGSGQGGGATLNIVVP